MKIELRGLSRSDQQSVLEREAPSLVTVLGTFAASNGRATTMASKVLDAEPTDLIEWEQDGVAQWRPVAMFAADARRGADVIEIVLPWDSIARSPRSTVSLVRVARAAEPIESIEASLLADAAPAAKSALSSLWTDAAATDNAGESSRLLFLHGFASSTHGSFHRWTNSAATLDALKTRYREGLAFNHATIAKSPVDNAIELAGALSAAGVRTVEVLGFSRGGLVAELLAGRAYADKALVRWMVSKHGDEWHALEEKLRVLDAARDGLEVTRVVRVASPVAGTRLAGDVPHAALSLMLSALLRSVAMPTAASTATKQLLLRLLTMLAHRSLPGLFDLRPDSALVRFLSAAPRVGATRRLAVAASVQSAGGSFWQASAQWASEKLFHGANDLVVSERSALAGTSNDERLTLSGSRTHFECFDSTDATPQPDASPSPTTTLDALLRAPVALRDVPIVSEPGRAGAGGAEARSADDAHGERAAWDVRGRPLSGYRVLIVPGIMGSTLDDEQGPVWLSPTLMHGSFARLAYTAANNGVRATGLVEPAYWLLQRALEALGATVVRGFYDWRRPIADCAQEVADRCERELRDGRLAIVAHSMGGVVTRKLLLRWRAQAQIELLDRLERVLFLGVPHRGSFNAALARDGQEGLVRALGCADATQNLDEVVQVIQTFPGLEALIPHALATQVQSQPLAESIDDLREFTEQFAADLSKRAPSRAARFITVLGAPPLVATHQSMDPRDRQCGVGDGRVLHSSSALGDEPKVHIAARHGSIPQSPGFLQAMAAMITSGTSAGSSLLGALFARETAPALPVVDEPLVLMSAAMGADIDTLRASDAALYSPGQTPFEPVAPNARDHQLSIAIHHGSVRAVQLACAEIDEDERATQPVRALVLGRLEQPRLDGVLRDLDALLDNTIRRRFELGAIDAKIGSIHTFSGGRTRLPLVVFGLGRMIAFDREAFVSAASDGFVRAACDAVDAAMASGRPSSAGTVLVELCSALPSALAASTAEQLQRLAEAVVEALLIANRALAKVSVQIARYVHFEQHRDSAWALLRAFEGATRSVRLELERSERVWVEPQITRGDGYCGSRFARPAAVVDVATVTIRGSIGAEQTQFEFVHDDGRAAMRSDRGQLSDARRDALFALAAMGRADEARDLLADVVPPWFEQLARSGRDVELVLDSASAAIPWEVVADGLGPRRANVIRRLTVAPRRSVTASTNTALVIADPYADAPQWSLAGARREGVAVRAALEAAGFETEQPLGATSGDAVRALSKVKRGVVRVLHIAAHGDFSAESGAGVVLLGPGEALDASWWWKLDVVPEVVVLNCCSSGRIAPELQRGMASLAEVVLASGVRLFVAAAWPVSDEGAAEFGAALHRELLDGVAFAEAVRRARVALRARDPRSSTWAAFQAYGDPSYRMLRGAVTEPLRFVHDEEAIDAALTLLGDFRSRPSDQRATLEAAFEGLQRATGASTSGALRYHLAVCAMEVRRLDEAVDHLLYASQREDAPLSSRVWLLEALSRRAFALPSPDWNAVGLVSDSLEATVTSAGSSAAIAHAILRRAVRESATDDATMTALVKRMSTIAASSEPIGRRVAQELRALVALCRYEAIPVPEPKSSPLPSVTERLTRAHATLAGAIEGGRLSDSTRARVIDAYRAAVGMRASANWALFVEQWLACVAAVAKARGHESAEGLSSLSDAIRQWG